MASIRDVIERKGGSVVSIDQEETVLEAIRLMSEANIGSIVVEQDGSAAGIFTERDYLRKIALEGRSSNNTRVSEVMSVLLITVGPDESTEEAMETMTECRCRHLLVTDGDSMIGIVSLGDLVKHMLQEAEKEVEQLSDYIAGNH
ncbi:MAG: CBS domain-containing protein [Lysobacterales bacterium]|jgi:CBS domain-containing protein